MKERPILFGAPMVRAVLEGIKTKTRRVVKPFVYESIRGMAGNPGVDESEVSFKYGKWRDDDGEEHPAEWLCYISEYREEGVMPIGQCPYGQSGDQLWVRESFCKIIGQTAGWIETDYKATYTHGDRLGDSMGIKKVWKPSIHMPRDASRITLEVSGIHIERLQDISEADAVAEGCAKNHNGFYWGGPHAVSGLKQFASSVAAYRDLWESINGFGSWELNPWVWVIEFTRVSL